MQRLFLKRVLPILVEPDSPPISHPPDHFRQPQKGQDSTRDSHAYVDRQCRGDQTPDPLPSPPISNLGTIISEPMGKKPPEDMPSGGNPAGNLPSILLVAGAAIRRAGRVEPRREGPGDMARSAGQAGVGSPQVEPT